MAGKTSANTERDIAMYMSDIEKIIRQYRDLYAKAQAVQHKKGKDEERATIMTKRKELKGEFIRSKQACRALFKLLPPEHAEDREKALKELQKDFRAADTDIKELNMQVDRAALGLGTSNSTPNVGSLSGTRAGQRRCLRADVIAGPVVGAGRQRFLCDNSAAAASSTRCEPRARVGFARGGRTGALTCGPSRVRLFNPFVASLSLSACRAMRARLELARG